MIEDTTIVEQEVEQISRGEVRIALKSGKVTDDIPVEAWTCLGEMAEEFLPGLFNKILKSKNFLAQA